MWGPATEQMKGTNELFDATLNNPCISRADVSLVDIFTTVVGVALLTCTIPPGGGLLFVGFTA